MRIISVGVWSCGIRSSNPVRVKFFTQQVMYSTLFLCSTSFIRVVVVRSAMRSGQGYWEGSAGAYGQYKKKYVRERKHDPA